MNPMLNERVSAYVDEMLECGEITVEFTDAEVADMICDDLDCDIACDYSYGEILASVTKVFKSILK